MGSLIKGDLYLAYAITHSQRNSYLLGKAYSVADVYLFVTLSWGHHVNVDARQWPALARYYDNIAARPAVQKAFLAEGLIPAT